MKVDIKITDEKNEEWKSGLFGKKIVRSEDVKRVTYQVIFSEEEKAKIKKFGFDTRYLAIPPFPGQTEMDVAYPETGGHMPIYISSLLPGKPLHQDYGMSVPQYAQLFQKELVDMLKLFKQALDVAAEAPTSTSFEL